MMSWMLVLFLFVMEPSGRYHTEMRVVPQIFTTQQECAQRYANMKVGEIRLKPGERLVRAYGRCEVEYDI